MNEKRLNGMAGKYITTCVFGAATLIKFPLLRHIF